MYKSLWNNRIVKFVLTIVLVVPLLCGQYTVTCQRAIAKGLSLSDIPKWSGKAYVEINNNSPSFSKKQKKRKTYTVKYYKRDKYKRAVKAYGCLGPETLNDKEREGIGHIKPVGWETKKYPEIIDGLYVYNRCHLLMQAAAAGVKKDACNGYKNLITGTRYLNVDGMLPFESEILSYIRRTDNHVLYRVKPIYKGAELIARGVQMEAYSLEDKGKGVRFNVYCYNAQPGIKIDYKTGKTEEKSNPAKDMKLAVKNGATTVNASGIKEDTGASTGSGSSSSGSLNDHSRAEDAREYVLNTNTKRFHYPSCSSVTQMAEHNKWKGTFSRSELIEHGYKACGNCHP